MPATAAKVVSGRVSVLLDQGVFGFLDRAKGCLAAREDRLARVTHRRRQSVGRIRARRADGGLFSREQSMRNMWHEAAPDGRMQALKSLYLAHPESRLRVIVPS